MNSPLTLEPNAPTALFPGQGSQSPDMREPVARRCPELRERRLGLVDDDPFARGGGTRVTTPEEIAAHA